MATEVSSQPARRAPRQSIGALEWLRQNLFSSWLNGIITLVMLFLVYQVLSAFLTWLFTTQGWAAALNNVRLISVGRYPAAEVWRVQVCVALVAVLTGLSGGIWRGIPQALALSLGIALTVIGLLSFGFPNSATGGLPGWAFLFGSAICVGIGYAVGRGVGIRLRWPVLIGWLLLYPIAIIFIRGFGPLPIVNTDLWGGLMLTMILAISGIVLSFPLGVLLALGRRSKLPVIKGFCIAYIELIRGVPLVTVLFMSAIMLPLFLPADVRVDAVVRAIVAVTLFSAAYLAENVRGGLQSIPNGQEEAARALGLNTFQTIILITLPQALRAVIPVLVSQFISLFKDTSLVVIIGLIDLLGIAQSIITQPEWLGTPGGVWRETYFVIAMIYWIFSFTISRTSKQIEEQLNVAHR
ncbi:MAG: amino acid ABC transporter permease [Oscillochloris sp.]|nr:amino acid ABC transporter permease [Oscillochloris sp.]